jgi:hypothetical protein
MVKVRIRLGNTSRVGFRKMKKKLSLTYTYLVFLNPEPVAYLFLFLFLIACWSSNNPNTEL